MNKLLMSVGLVGALAVGAVPVAIAQQQVSSSTVLVALSSEWDIDSTKIGNDWYYKVYASGRLKNNTNKTIVAVLGYYEEVNWQTNQVLSKGQFGITDPIAPGEAVRFKSYIGSNRPSGSLRITQLRWKNADGTVSAYEPTWRTDQYFCDGGAFCFNLYGR